MAKSPFDGLVPADRLKDAESVARASGRSVAEVLQVEHSVSLEAIGKALASFYRTEFVPYSDAFPVPPADLLSVLPHDYCMHYPCVPLSRSEGRAVVLVADPRNLEVCDDLARLLGGRVTFKVSTCEEIRRFLDRFHPQTLPQPSGEGPIPPSVGAPDYSPGPPPLALVPGPEDQEAEVQALAVEEEG